MLRASGNGQEKSSRSGKPQQQPHRGEGTGEVVEPDHRIIFAVLAVGMLVGALLMTPARGPATAKAKAPANVAANGK